MKNDGDVLAERARAEQAEAASADLRAQLEQLEQENKELLARVDGVPASGTLGSTAPTSGR